MRSFGAIFIILAIFGFCMRESRGQYYDRTNELTAPGYVDSVAAAVGAPVFDKINRHHALELAGLLNPMDREALTPAAFVEHVEEAESVRNCFYPKIDEINFRTYLLPMRIRAEPCSSTGWHKELRTDLESEIAGLTAAGDVANKVLGWCKSKVQVTDQDRCYPLGLKGDLDPMTTLRAGAGSEVDLTILSIAALRSVGIAARLVTAPTIAGESGGKVWLEYWTDAAWHAWSASAPAGMDARKYLLQEFGTKFALIVANPDEPLNITASYIPVAHVQIELDGIAPQSRCGWNLLVPGKDRLLPATGRDIYIHLSDTLDVGPGNYVVVAGSRDIGTMKSISIRADETGSYVLNAADHGTQSFTIDPASAAPDLAAASSLNPEIAREPGLW